MEMIVIALDKDGLPRAYASGDVESNDDLDDIKEVCQRMVLDYIASKPYRLNFDDFTYTVEIVD